MAFVTPVVEHRLERKISNLFITVCHTGPEGAVTVLLANGLVGIGFVSRYQLQPKAGF